MNRNKNPLVLKARALRRTAEPATQVLWEALRGRRLGGFKFRRQVSIGPHFLDFVCHERAVVILVEEGATPSPIGRGRDEFLMSEGFSVFRVCAVNVLTDLAGVQDAILAVLQNRLEDFIERTPSSARPQAVLQ